MSQAESDRDDSASNRILHALLLILVLPFAFVVIAARIVLSVFGIAFGEDDDGFTIPPRLKPLLARIDLAQVEHAAETDTGEHPANAIARLAEAGDWDRLSTDLAALEAGRTAATGLARPYEQAAMAARHALSEATQAAQHCSMMTIADIPLEILDRMEAARARRPGDHVLAAVTARAHIDVGWYHRSGGWSDDVTEEGWEGIAHHYGRPREILDRFDTEALNSPLLAEARYYLCLGEEDPSRALEKAHAVWARLDPQSLTPHTTHAFHLLPRWGGSYEALDIAARQATTFTADRFGTGAYAACYLSVIARDVGTLGTVEVPFFEEALDDLVARTEGAERDRTVTSCLVALFAASKPLDTRAEMLRLARKLAERHLRGIDLALWHRLDLAKTVLAACYEAELTEGARLRLDDTGPTLLPPEAAEAA